MYIKINTLDARLKVPYNYSDPACDFDYGRKITMDEYNKEMIGTYRKYKPIIDRNIHKLGSNLAINNEGAKENNRYKQQNTYLTETKADVRDWENREIMIDQLLEYYKTGEMFVIDLQLPVYERNEELEPEVKAWMRETMKINSAEGLTDEERVTGYTKRDLKLEFPNSTSCAILRNTKLIDIVNNHTFAFLVEQIIFLNNN